jgi:hypothetical protein
LWRCAIDAAGEPSLAGEAVRSEGRRAVVTTLKADQYSKAMTLESGVVNRMVPDWMTVAYVAIAAAIVVADCVIPKINLSILFAVPLVMVARANRHAATTMRAALVLSVFTYLDYYLRLTFVTHVPNFWLPEHLLRPWLLNRSLVAVVLVMIAAVSSSTQRQRERMAALSRLRAQHPEDADQYDNLLVAFEQLVWAVVCAIIMVGVFALDVVTPAPWNLPILYILPVVVSAWGASRYLTWGLVPFALLANVAGFYMGPWESNTALAQSYGLNRVVAAVAVVLVALVVNVVLEYRQRQPVEPAQV